MFDLCFLETESLSCITLLLCQGPVFWTLLLLIPDCWMLSSARPRQSGPEYVTKCVCDVEAVRQHQKIAGTGPGIYKFTRKGKKVVWYVTR